MKPFSDFVNASMLARVLPFIIYIAFLAINPLLTPLLPDARWAYAIKILAVTVALLMFARSYVELRITGILKPDDVIFAGVCGVIVFIAWINLDQGWASIGKVDGFDPRNANGAIDITSAMIRLFGASIIVPIMEELFWRSFILRWIDNHHFLELEPARISIRALAYSSIVFGFEHTLWLAGIIAGMVYGWVYMRKGNLWLPIISHATTNFLLGIWVLYTGNWKFW